jgi:aminopeptidase N
MKQFCTSLLLIFLWMSCASDRKKLILEKGISYELAQYRKQQLSDIVYRLHFSIPKEKDQPIPTTLQVEFTVNDLQNDVFLDFNEATAKLKSIKINDKKASINHQKEHIIVAKSSAAVG